MGSNTLTRAVRGALYAGVTASALALAACGGSGGGGGGDGSGSVSLGLTDSPVTGAKKVTVEFTGVDILEVDGNDDDGNSGGEESAFKTITFDQPRSINLLNLQGNAAESLLSGVELEAGEYRFRLNVNAKSDGEFDSFIILSDGTQKELKVPSGARTGLKTTGTFTIAAGDTRNFTIDFDVRKSVTDPPGKKGVALLRPTLRLINNVETGTLAGEAAGTFVVDTVDGTDVTVSSASCGGPAVYVYDAENFESAGELGSSNDPLATANLEAPEEGSDTSNYSYEVGFLEEGSYEVAVACADGDSPDNDNDNVPISSTSSAEVTADGTTTLKFGL